MTLKEMLLQVNDRLSFLEEKIEHNNIVIANLMDTVDMLADAVKSIVDVTDVPYSNDNIPIPINSVKIPFSTPDNLLEKLKDPIFMEEFKNNFKKEAESIIEFEKELEKVQDQIIKGKVGES